MRMSKAKSDKPAQGLLAAVGLLDDEAVVGEPLRNRLTQRRLVVYDQQMFRRFSHLVGRRYFDTLAASGSAFGQSVSELPDGVAPTPSIAMAAGL